MKTTTTYDTYEATWYILNGGIIKNIKFKRLQPNRIKKEGFTIVYKITIEGIEQRYIDQWKGHQANGDIRSFANARKKLKRKIEKVKKRESELTI